MAEVILFLLGAGVFAGFWAFLYFGHYFYMLFQQPIDTTPEDE